MNTPDAIADANDSTRENLDQPIVAWFIPDEDNPEYEKHNTQAAAPWSRSLSDNGRYIINRALEEQPDDLFNIFGRIYGSELEALNPLTESISGAECRFVGGGYDSWYWDHMSDGILLSGDHVNVFAISKSTPDANKQYIATESLNDTIYGVVFTEGIDEDRDLVTALENQGVLIWTDLKVAHKHIGKAFLKR